MPTSTPASGSRAPGTSGSYDLVVVGAGPAGLAGAVAAAEHGLSVALLDGDAQLGGQFYRHPAPGLGAERPEALHHDWTAFDALRRRWKACGGTHLPRHHVWTVASERAATPGAGTDGASWVVHAVTGSDGGGERPVEVRGRAVLLATGAAERHLPFPGWTLPGVIGAGGAQAMLKSGLVLPGGRVVVAGSGPLLLAVASSLVAAGSRVPALVEAAGYLGYARRPDVLAAGPGKMAEAAGHVTRLLRHGTRPFPRHAVVRAHGTERVEAVTVARLDGEWRPVPGTERRIPCDAVAVGHGLVPRIDLATALGCATRRTVDGAVALALDARQRTSVPGLWSAGETAGVGGALLALTEGELAGTAVAMRLRGASVAGPSARIPSLLRTRTRLRAFASLMATAHRPGDGWRAWLDDDTEVCRCEEVTAGRIREAVESLGAGDARTVKLLTRAGMGWCQGRVCGPAVACLAGGASGARRQAPLPSSPERRPLAVPVPLSALAALAPPGEQTVAPPGEQTVAPVAEPGGGGD
ncbi:FAD-dependent oxidoreductase [Streptomyces sp. ISL-36]|uniref:FAD/NAD(P)-dependent oxidoreductase n=1 Tax=Streptomyces sp. ISL-36 TaxID=2819182 RepID=UPI001BEC6DE5|nr:NAD(P)/FAD-dependent oxidoreductase [Streptomyces sp. ISL-36]MBT2443212.1 FAD-dependent oxidoreductase [Streptomyces sp. ISL-36]